MDDDEHGLMAPPQDVAAAKASRDPARAKFLFIASHRVVGAVLVMLGMLAMQGALDWGKDLGKVLAIVGLIEFFLLPLILARLWKSLPE